MGVAIDQAWCILRTSGAKTLPLANSLAAAGFDVWTPRESYQRRRPRSKSTVDLEKAIVPTFVFVRAHHLVELAAARTIDPSPHPAFSIFHYAGRIPVIADREVDGFRKAEGDAQLREKRTRKAKLATGQSVTVEDGAFAGLEGVVTDQQGRYAMVAFKGGFRMQIATWLLASDQLNNDQPPMGSAAKAA